MTKRSMSKLVISFSRQVMSCSRGLVQFMAELLQTPLATHSRISFEDCLDIRLCKSVYDRRYHPRLQLTTRPTLRITIYSTYRCLMASSTRYYNCIPLYQAVFHL